jgi:hypothetical protein
MRRLAGICEKVVGIGIGALVLFTPFAFGSLETWASVILVTTSFVLGAVWLVGRLASGRSIAGTGLEIPMALFFALVLFQIIPLPRSILSIVSPRIEALYERTVPGVPIGGTEFEDWLLASDSSTAPPATVAARAIPEPLTYSVPDTLDRLLLFAAFAVVFLLVADLFRDREKRLRLIVWIVCVGCAVGIEGIFQKLAWNGKVLWLRSPPTGSRPFGPFVNPNHFAGYMELIPVALGLLLTPLPPRSEEASGTSSRARRRTTGERPG